MGLAEAQFCFWEKEQEGPEPWASYHGLWAPIPQSLKRSSWQTYFAWPSVEKTTKSICWGWFCCKAGKLWWSIFCTCSFWFLKYISFQGWLYILSAVTLHKEYIKWNYWQEYLAPSINCRILDENEWQLHNHIKKKIQRIILRQTENRKFVTWPVSNGLIWIHELAAISSCIA